MNLPVFPKNRWLSFLNAVLDAWVADRCASKAAALAFYTIFSLAPLLLILAAVIGVFFGSEATINEIVREATQLVGEAGAGVLRQILASAGSGHDASISTIVATVVLAVGITSAFTELKDSLDDIWQAPADAPHGWWHALESRLLSFVFVFALSILMITSLSIDALLAIASDRILLREGIEQADLARAVSITLSVGIIFVLFTLIYKLLPSIRISWRNAARAATLTTTLFVIGRLFIGFYLGSLASTSVYGAAASLAVLLLWIYYSAAIFFMSAEIARFWLGLAEDDAGVIRRWLKETNHQ